MSNVNWKKRGFKIDKSGIEFKGNVLLPQHILDLETPRQVFKYFFTNDMLQHIYLESSKYSISLNPNKPFSLTIPDLKKYI
jgi:hypothetical protein